MKLRRLPETDLARIAPLSTEKKWTALRSFNSGGGSWSYDPARAQNFNVANPLDPLGLESRRPSMEKIRQLVVRRCRCEAQEISCLQVVDLFATWHQNRVVGAFERQIPSMAIGSLGLVRYWENFFLRIGERNTFLFVDYRQSGGLNPQACKFVFSMMHQQIRLADPDFYDADLAIVRFPKLNQSRVAKDIYVDNDDLFSLSELNQMIGETYEIWIEILSEKKDVESQRLVRGLFG